MEQGSTGVFETSKSHHSHTHTTIALQKVTRERLYHNLAPGQCYDDFINQLLEDWERYRVSSSLCGPGKPIDQIIEK